MGTFMGTQAWGDYDNDGDLDILLKEQNDHTTESTTKLYRNDINIKNIPPDSPQDLAAMVEGSDVVLNWKRVTTDATKFLSHNVRVGTTPGACNVVSPQSAQNGFRRIPAMGNAQLDTFLILKNLPNGNYYYSVVYCFPQSNKRHNFY